MSFIVETGDIIQNANSLCSVEFADSYFSDRGVSDWTGSTLVKQQSLVKATDYIENYFASYFKSEIIELTQPLCFPRLLYGNLVPEQIKKAICELGLRSLVSQLILNPQPTADVFLIKKQKTIIGPITKEYEFDVNKPNSGVVSLSNVNALLRPFLDIQSGVMRV